MQAGQQVRRCPQDGETEAVRTGKERQGLQQLTQVSEELGSEAGAPWWHLHFRKNTRLLWGAGEAESKLSCGEGPRDPGVGLTGWGRCRAGVLICCCSTASRRSQAAGQERRDRAGGLRVVLLADGPVTSPGRGEGAGRPSILGL